MVLLKNFRIELLGNEETLKCLGMGYGKKGGDSNGHFDNVFLKFTETNDNNI